MRARKKLGDMLVEAGLLSREQLDRAVADQRKTSLKLGQFLVREGFVNEEAVVNLLSVQLKVAKYTPDAFPVDVDLAGVIPVNVAQKHQLAPLAKRPNLVVVAMLDPTDIHALDAVEDVTRCEVEPVICTEAALSELIGTIYGMSLSLEGAMESLEAVEYGGEGGAAASEEMQVRSLMDMAEGVTAVRMVNWLIAQAVREGASDIHVCPERTHVQIRFRVDGKLKDVPALPRPMLLSIISRLKILAKMDIAVSRVPQDGRFTVRIGSKEVNIRASAIPTINGENMVLRLLDIGARVYKLDHLGMSPEDVRTVEQLITRPYGMILSTGPTGSGKTTTLYSILNVLNQPEVNIITVEDPVEYRIARIRQLELNVKAGMTFASALRSILRHDPDIIMVGEIRDSETATIAVQAALTGHRVLSTAHTNDAAGAITRLIDMGIEPFLVSAVLMVAFAQRLVRRVCSNCGKPFRPGDELLRYWGLRDTGDAQFMKGEGCFLCRHTGYRGRTGIFEVLVVDEAIQNMILRRDPLHDIVKHARETGRLTPLKEAALQKVLQGVTTFEEAAATVVV